MKLMSRSGIIVARGSSYKRFVAVAGRNPFAVKPKVIRNGCATRGKDQQHERRLRIVPTIPDAP